MNPFRKVLRHLLGLLSKWAIAKHQLELIVVAGWYGTSLAREMLYTILSDKLKVRRNIKEIWWDFSIPLAILGYKDERRNVLQWIILLLRAIVYLIVGRANPHILILDADCTYDMTAKYWASFIHPDYLLILNYEREAKVVRELIKATDREKGLIIYNPETTNKNLVKRLNVYNTFMYGEEAARKLKVKISRQNVKISYNNSNVTLPKSYLPSFSVDMLGGIFSVAMLKGLELTEAGFNSLKFEIPTSIVAKIRSNLEFKNLQ